LTDSTEPRHRERGRPVSNTHVTYGEKQGAAARDRQPTFVASAPAPWQPISDTSFGRVDDAGDLIAVARIRVRRGDAVSKVAKIRESMGCAAAADHRIYTRSIADLELGEWWGFSVADLLVATRGSVPYLTERAAVLVARGADDLVLEVDASTPYLDAIPDLSAEVRAIAASVRVVETDG